MANVVILGSLGGYLGLVYLTFYAPLSTRIMFLSNRQLKELFSEKRDEFNESPELDIPLKDLANCAQSSILALILGPAVLSLFLVKNFGWGVVLITAVIELITVSSYVYLFLPWFTARKGNKQPP
jgi:hypothetical protein